MSFKTERVEGTAKDLVGWVEGMRAKFPNGYGWVTLREFTGVTMEVKDATVPGALIEGVRLVNSGDMDMSLVEVTIWGFDEMQVLMLSPDTKVAGFKVTDDGEGN